jgi:predicted nicotinamide N-methyase
MTCGEEPCSFAHPANPDDVLDSMTNDQYEKDKFLPYWAQQWPACSPLFDYFSSEADLLTLRYDSICEIGCGLGILSTLFQMKKVSAVVATDFAFDACRYTAYNMRQYSPSPLVVCSDWRFPPFRAKFDCIVGSDILYEQRWISPVLDFLKSTLKSDGACYIADPCRQWWEEFQDKAVSLGFTLSKVRQDIVNQGKTTVEIVRLDLKKAQRPHRGKAPAWSARTRD